MVLRPFLGFDVAVDFGVEDEKGVFQFNQMRTHPLAMLFQQRTPLRTSLIPPRAKFSILQHFAYRHSGGFQAFEEANPNEDGFVIIALSASITISKR